MPSLAHSALQHDLPRAVVAIAVSALSLVIGRRWWLRQQRARRLAAGGERRAITKLMVYPIKSCEGVSVPRARLQPRGLEHDRAYAICVAADSAGPGTRTAYSVVTARELPVLVQLRPQVPVDEGMVIRTPFGEETFVPLVRSGPADSQSHTVAYPAAPPHWYEADATDQGDAAAEFITRCIRRLVADGGDPASRSFATDAQFRLFRFRERAAGVGAMRA